MIEAEILDSLPADDPEAARSRRDLALVNALMGNFRWLQQAVTWAVGEREGPVWELGAGDGVLLGRLQAGGINGTGVDQVARPEGMHEGIGWRQGDVFETLRDGIGGVVIANLFLHHFRDDQLAEIGRLLDGCEVLCVVEPWRSRLALLEGYLLFPRVNRVTRHDMTASIRAGFRRGDLPRLLGLGNKWEVREQCTLLGACRMLAWRNP